MSKIKILFILLALFVANHSSAQNKLDDKGRKQGEWVKTHPKSRAVLYKGQFIDDKPTGVFYYYYVTGKKQAIISHNHITGRSVAFFYHENGSVMTKGIYNDMKKDSVWTGFGPSGRLSYREHYEKDILNGKKTVYYISKDPHDKSQKVASITNYVGGKIEGEFVSYFDNNVVKEKGTYLNNKKHGVWVANHPNGHKSLEQRFKNGVVHGWCMAYNANGSETTRKYFYYGQILEGEELKKKMQEMKAKGINPNQ